jgi:hypothetical protein
MTDAIVARLERWRGWLKTAYVWNELDEEMFAAALKRLEGEPDVAAK